MNHKLYIAACASLMLAACAGAVVTAYPWAQDTTAAWQAQPATTRTIGLGLPGGAVLAPQVTFAGGVQLLTPTVSPLRSLSDLKLIGDEGFITISDAGDLVRGSLRLDESGQLVGLDQLRSHRLSLMDGQPIIQKVDGDAEGIAITSDGDLLVSFERDHRIWNYGPLDAMTRPTAMVRPIWPFKQNGGIEAIASGTAQGPAGYRVAGEDGGVWDCLTTCQIVTTVPATDLTDADYRITGMDRDPVSEGWFVVQRSFRPPMDARARVRLMDRNGQLGPVLVELKLPGTTDNFEGIAATRRGDMTRLYILSDDNQNPLQRTLMLAFDLRR